MLRDVRCCIGRTRSRGWWKRLCGGIRFSTTWLGGSRFYDRAEVKDILSYMKLVQNVNDSIALNRVVNSPPRGIGKTTMEVGGEDCADDGGEYVGCDC